MEKFRTDKCKYCNNDPYWGNLILATIDTNLGDVDIFIEGNTFGIIDSEEGRYVGYPGITESFKINFCPMCGRDLKGEK